MTALADPTLGSTWFRCAGCEFAGDGLVLAVHLRNDRPAFQVAYDLADAGFPTRPLADADDRAVAAWDAHAARWREARGLVAGYSSPAIDRVLRQQYGVDPAPAGLGVVCGPDRDDLVAYLGGSSRFSEAWARGRARSCQQADHARPGRDDLFGLVYEDLPGRVRGVLLACGEAAYPREWSYVRLLNVPAARRRDPVNADSARDAGLFNLSAVLDAPAHPRLGATVLAVHRPDWALGLLAACRRERGEAVPVVAPWHGAAHETGASWDLLAGRPVVHVVARFDADAIAAARRTGGRLVRTDDMDPSKMIAPLAWAAGAEYDWTDAVNLAARHAPDDELRTLARRLDLGPSSSFSRAANDRLRRLAGPAGPRALAARNKRYKVVERGGEWRTTTGLLVSDAILEVTHQVYFPAADPGRDDKDPGRRLPPAAAQYRGVVRHGDAAFPFSVPASSGRFVRTTTEWMRRFLLREGRVLRGQHNLGRGLLDVAFEFRPPTPVTVPPFVGPDREAGGFVFPRFRLRPNGEAEELPVPLTELDPDGLPFADLGPPTPADRERAALLDYRHLAAVGLYAACLLSPGDGWWTSLRPCVDADAAGHLSRGMGFPTAARHVHAAVFVADPASPSGMFCAREEAARRAIAGAHVLDFGLPAPPAPADPGDLARTLAAYLQDLLRRRNQLPPGPCTCLRVLGDLFAWAGAVVPGVAVPDGLAHCPATGRNLAYALRYAIAAGHARPDTRPSLAGHGPGSLFVAGGAVHVPYALLCRLAGRGAATLPDDVAKAVGRAVLAAGMEVRLGTVGREAGYLLDAGWFSSNVGRLEGC